MTGWKETWWYWPIPSQSIPKLNPYYIIAGCKHLSGCRKLWVPGIRRGQELRELILHMSQGNSSQFIIRYSLLEALGGWGQEKKKESSLVVSLSLFFRSSPTIESLDQAKLDIVSSPTADNFTTCIASTFPWGMKLGNEIARTLPYVDCPWVVTKIRSTFLSELKKSHQRIHRMSNKMWRNEGKIEWTWKYYAFHVEIHVSAVAPWVNPSKNSCKDPMESIFDEVALPIKFFSWWFYELLPKKIAISAWPEVEPGTSRPRSENHSTRPISRPSRSLLLSLNDEIPLADWFTPRTMTSLTTVFRHSRQGLLWLKCCLKKRSLFGKLVVKFQTIF